MLNINSNLKSGFWDNGAAKSIYYVSLFTQLLIFCTENDWWN